MASRRLDISSLLCNDETTEHSPHAPHSRYSTQSPYVSTSSSFPSQLLSPHPQLNNQPLSLQPHLSRHPTSNQYPLQTQSVSSPHRFPSPSSAISSKPSSFGLEALVQAATEERRRLSNGSSTFLDIPKRTSPPIEQRQSSQPQQHHHSHSTRQFKSSSNDRVFSPSNSRSPILSPMQNIPGPIQPARSPTQSILYSPTLQQQLPSRHRAADRHHTSSTEPQAQQNLTDDVQYRLPPPYFTPVPQPQPSRQLSEHELRLQHQHELQLQRQHHEHLPFQGQQQRSLQHQILYSEKNSPISSSPWSPPAPFYASTTPQVSNRSFFNPSQTTGRKSDPGQPHRVLTPTHPSAFPLPVVHQSPAAELLQASLLPSKRRRYSDSPVHSATVQHAERPHQDRGEMAIGPELSVPSNVNDFRGSGSGRNQSRKHIGLAELMTTERSVRQSHPPTGSQSALEPSHDRSLPSPFAISRRSHPGSEAGRAIAAKKSEEIEHNVQDIVPQATPQVSERPSSHSRRTSATTTTPEPAPIAQKVPPPPMQDETTADAHEWFLEHFNDDNPSTILDSSRSRAKVRERISYDPSPGSVPAPLPVQRASESPSEKCTPIPSTMPEAAAALEQELNELLGDSSEHASKVEPDTACMDVDLAINELFAETLETSKPKVEDVGMEIDVEDELLSLVDDRHPARCSTSKSATPGTSVVKSHTVLRANSNVVRSPPALSTVSTSPSEIILTTPSTQLASEYGSVPPPPPSLTYVKREEKEVKTAEETKTLTPVVSTKKKRKDVTPKPGHKPKATSTSSATSLNAKIRSKPGPKPKQKVLDVSQSKVKGSVGSKKLPASRSRSTSVMPAPDSSDAKAEKQEEEESDHHEDDKLYCVCKTKYDEERFMIACDRCDEWYHTTCVNMPDLEVDLVDQFICPICIEKNSHLSLRTTYKARCLYGLRHPDPDSSKACHKPARGAFSKYCSDECGVKYMQSHADVWTKKGGKTQRLWEVVKDAEKREGVVVCAVERRDTKVNLDEECNNGKDKARKLKKAKVEREFEQLNKLLESVVKLREELKKGMECVEWREKLLELAVERAEQLGECGWDQRLCFGDEEWSDFGADVLESYEEVKSERDGSERGASEGDGEWWCIGKKMCERHAGWQAVRHKDVCKEKEKKRDALSNLTTREREIRKRIEDILDPHGRNRAEAPVKSPLKATNGKLPNGHAKGKTNVDTTKRGKKRKVPS